MIHSPTQHVQPHPPPLTKHYNPINNKNFDRHYDNSNYTTNNKEKLIKHYKNNNRMYSRHRINARVSNNHTNRFKKSLTNKSKEITDSQSYITNLSSKKLNLEQTKVLSLGLTFIPSSKLKKPAMLEAATHFQRQNRIRYFFRNQPPGQNHPFRLKSTWQPPKASTEIEMYLEKINNTLKDPPIRPFFHNLNRQELLALNTLAKDDSLIIKNADKGSGIVVEDTEKYIQAGKEHLSDTNIYETINEDPTSELIKATNEYVNYCYRKGILDSITKDYLTFKKDNPPRTQQLYFLKKIHKTPIAVRPIVSGSGGPTERISQFIDFHLQPHVPLIDSYIKDSGHMINILENLTIPPNCSLVTIDVKSLYLNIPHKDGIQAVTNRLYYNNPKSDEIPIPTGTMKDLLNIVLTKNYFEFAGEMYHQVQGTAMGTKMAPAYANIFMAELEEKLLADYPIKPIVWKRYIDDVFCIWPGQKEEVKKFIEYLNQAHSTIKFTYECSNTTIDFLDLTVYKGTKYKTQRKLDIKPFFKKTNKFQYLHYTSAHPRNTFSSLIKGEQTRLLRACSDKQEYNNIQDKMYRAFRDRGYPAKLIKKVQETVPFEKRTQILQGKQKENSPYDTFLVMPYTPDLDLKSLKQSLKPQEEECEIPKPCLSLKKTKNLRDKLVRAKIKNTDSPITSTEKITITCKPNLDGRSAGCATPGCKCCSVMSRKIKITSSSNYKSFTTPKHTNCRTNTIIYLLECKKCPKRNQYVGQTQRNMSQRLAGHRAARKIKINLPIYKHFRLPNHNFESDIKVTILEKTTKELLDSRERHWINTLETVFPKGLNSRYE